MDKRTRFADRDISDDRRYVCTGYAGTVLDGRKCTDVSAAWDPASAGASVVWQGDQTDRCSLFGIVVDRGDTAGHAEGIFSGG